MFNKIKGLLKDDTIFYAILIGVVVIAAFGLGQLSSIELSAGNDAKAITVIPAPDPVVRGAESSVGGIQNFIASKNGTKYHALTCPGAKQIAEKNALYFASVAEAASAGYTPAANCQFE